MTILKLWAFVSNDPKRNYSVNPLQLNIPYRTIAGLCDGDLEHTGVILLDHGDTAVAADMMTLRDLDDPRCWNDYICIFTEANQREIFADIHIRFPDGTVEKIYATQDAEGNLDLGINASNDDYMRLHGIPEAERAFYSLSSIDLAGVEICEPTEDMAPTLTM